MEDKNKVTKRVMLNRVIEVATELGRQDIVEFAKSEIELLDRKNANRKPTKAQLENEKIKETILIELERVLNAKKVDNICVKDLFEASEELQKNDNSIAKITQLLLQLQKANLVDCIKLKGKNYYFLVQE